jgi:hypothetical protein
VQIVPLSAVPSQTVTVILNSQECIIHVYTQGSGLYLDLTVSGTLTIAGVICQDRNLLVINSYLGFVGDLEFIDRQGLSDPVYTGFNPIADSARYLLAYLLPSEIVAASLPTGPVAQSITVLQSTPTPTPTATPTPFPTPTPTPTPTATLLLSGPSAPSGVTIT